MLQRQTTLRWRALICGLSFLFTGISGIFVLSGISDVHADMAFAVGSPVAFFGIKTHNHAGLIKETPQRTAHLSNLFFVSMLSEPVCIETFVRQ